jgi:hypothetical protein
MKQLELEPNKYLAFDLEIYKEIPPEVDNWTDIAPLGITCGSTLTSDGQLITWYPKGQYDVPLPRQMSPEEVDEMLEYISAMQDDGYKVVTWNGLAFDFAVIHQECSDELKAECKQVATDHIDMMYHFFCVKGYRVGLNAVSIGLGFGGKTEGMSGAQAPVLWQKSVLDRISVLNYVDKDAIITMEICLATEEQGYFQWTSRSGRLNTFNLVNNKWWLAVKEASKLSTPDNSWMDNPVSRKEFTWWLDK